MHSINNIISSNTMKYCIITKNIVSTDTFLYLCNKIIYSSQDLSTYFMHNKLYPLPILPGTLNPITQKLPPLISVNRHQAPRVTQLA